MARRWRSPASVLHGESLGAVAAALVRMTTDAVWWLRARYLPYGSRPRRWARALRAWLRGRYGWNAQAQEEGADAAYATYLERLEAKVARTSTSQATLGSADGARLTFLTVVPGWRSDLLATESSLRAQRCTDWRWRIAVGEVVPGATPKSLTARDPRTSLIANTNPRAIPTMIRALAGDFVVLLAPGERLAPEAVTAFRAALSEAGVDLVYSDVDHLDDAGHRTDPFFKPDWSPEALLSCDLLAGAWAFRASLVDPSLDLSESGAGWRRRLGLQVGHSATRPRHVPHILSHRPQSARSVSDAEAEDLRRCLAEHLTRQGRLRPEVERGPRGWPLVRWKTRRDRAVSVVIPSRDRVDLLARCLGGLLERTAYEPLEVIVVDNGSVEDATAALYERHAEDRRFRVIEYEGPFNYSAACNRGARAARGELLLFLNNDTEVLHPDWLGLMAQWFEVDGVGGVGSKLLFPDGTLQHAGVIVGMGGTAGHLFHRQQEHLWSLFGSDDWYRNMSAVTAACMLVSRDAFEAIGGFDEAYRLVYGDVDLCLRLRAAGWRILYTPHARLVHHESLTRGKRVPRSDFELISSLLGRAGLLDGDPYYNPNLSYRSLRPVFRDSLDDVPGRLNRELMRRLPRKETFVVPDDLA